MKKIVATTLAALMLAAVSVGGTIETASAAPYSMHPNFHVVIKHPKHWHEHLVCTTHWRHHHKVKVCYWVPNHHKY